MGFELSVDCECVPENLGELWEEALAVQGIIVEIYPGFRPADRNGGFLPMKLIDLPEQYRFGLPNVVQISGFEVDFHESGAHFRTASGRTIAELILQCTCTAALAVLTDGLYIDPQSDETYDADSAMDAAHAEIMAYQPCLDDFARTQHPFTTWSDYLRQ